MALWTAPPPLHPVLVLAPTLQPHLLTSPQLAQASTRLPQRFQLAPALLRPLSSLLRPRQRRLQQVAALPWLAEPLTALAARHVWTLQRRAGSATQLRMQPTTYRLDP